MTQRYAEWVLLHALFLAEIDSSASAPVIDCPVLIENGLSME